MYKANSEMQKADDSISWGMFFDPVHIVSVNYIKREARLFENAGTGAGKLLIKKEQPAEVVSITDAMQLLNMGLRYGVSFDLLAQCADEEARTTLERLGAKDFLDRVLALTTEEERRMRFQGYNFAFANGGKTSESNPPAKREDGRLKKTTP